VVLCHISQANNNRELAELTVKLAARARVVLAPADDVSEVWQV
jgi:hypothetical protein